MLGPNLEKVPLVRGFSSDECRQLLQSAQTAAYQPGAVVLAEGEACRNLWIVLEGTCEVVKESDQTGRTMVLAELEPFAHFGEMSFFHPAPHSASVRAKTAVKLLRIGREEFDALANGGCSVAYKLAYNTIGGLAERLRRATDQLADATTSEAAKKKSEWSSFREKVFDGWNL